MKTRIERTAISPEKAVALLEDHRITIWNGKVVRWINLNNQTLFAERNGSGMTYDIEGITSQVYIDLEVEATNYQLDKFSDVEFDKDAGYDLYEGMYVVSAKYDGRQLSEREIEIIQNDNDLHAEIIIKFF